MTFTYSPIGEFRTPYRNVEEIPKIFGQAPVAEGAIHIDPPFEEGLLDIDRFTHLIILFAFHKSTAKPLQVTPPGQQSKRGVFASRSPQRPNAIGLLTVELLRREGAILFVRGVDVLDGTPVLDIKPYLLHLDCRPEARSGRAEEDR